MTGIDLNDNPDVNPEDDESIASPSRANALVLKVLVESIAPFIGIPVDELHVAAVLESRGVTDSVARDRYGHDDVFALAVALLPRLGHEPAAVSTRRPTTSAWRLMLHGALYLAPSLVIPAALVSSDRDHLVIGMVVATVIGWVWGMATSAVGYQYRGLERESTGAKAMGRMTIAGFGLALASAGVLTLLNVGGSEVAAVMAVQAAYQLGAGVLVFYRHEVTLMLAVVPSFVVGAYYLASGAPPRLVAPTVIAAVASAVLTAGAAAVINARAVAKPDRVAVAARLRLLASIGTPVAYAMLCAALLLSTNLRFFHSGPELALAATPLVLGMGAVEWRAERFIEGGVSLLESHQDLAPFRRHLWVRLILELCTVLGVIAVLAAALLMGLENAGRMTVMGSVLVAAYVLLGGVFFLGFVLSRHAHFPWFVASMAVVVATYIYVASLTSQPQAAVVLFLEATSALVLIFLAAFAACDRHIPFFTW